MTHDREIFRELHRSAISKDRIGNGDYLPAKGKGTVAIESYLGTKLISNVLFVPENLLCIGKLLENGFKLMFEAKKCVIYDLKGQQICQVKMRGKSFSFDSWRKILFLSKQDMTYMWNKRLGHFYHRALLYMLKKDMLRAFEDYHLWRMNTPLATHVNRESKVGCLLPRQPAEHH